MTGAEEDNRLIEAFRKGDDGALAALIDRHRGRLYIVIYRTLGERYKNATEDVLSDTLAQVWKGLAAFKGQSTFSSWSYRIAVNQARMHVRYRKRRPTVLFSSLTPEDRKEIDFSAADIEDVAKKMDVKVEVAAFLRTGIVDSHEKNLIWSKYVLGETFIDIAKRLGINLNTVKIRISRAIIRLRNELSGSGGQHATSKPDRPKSVNLAGRTLKEVSMRYPHLSHWEAKVLHAISGGRTLEQVATMIHGDGRKVGIARAKRTYERALRAIQSGESVNGRERISEAVRDYWRTVTPEERQRRREAMRKAIEKRRLTPSSWLSPLPPPPPS